MKNLLFLLPFLLLISCIKDNGTISQNDITTYENKIKTSGDKEAYVSLMVYYQNKENNTYKLLPYTFIMANKYNNPDAFVELYQNLIQLNNNGKYQDSLIVSLKKEEAQYALSLLKRGAEINDADCKALLAKHYEKGWGVIRNKKIADSLMNSIK